MIFNWVWGKTGFARPQQTETKSAAQLKRKGKVSSEKPKRKRKR